MKKTLKNALCCVERKKSSRRTRQVRLLRFFPFALPKNIFQSFLVLGCMIFSVHGAEAVKYGDVEQELFPTWTNNTLVSANIEILREDIEVLRGKIQKEEESLERTERNCRANYKNNAEYENCARGSQELIRALIDGYKEDINTLNETIAELQKDSVDLKNSSHTQVRGVIGQVGDNKFLDAYIPRLIDILLKFVAPILMAVMIYSGVLFIIAGDNDDELTQAKGFFMYALIGVVFIVLSYSIMRVVYFILAT